MQIVKRLMAAGAGSGTASFTVGPQGGIVVCRTLYYDCPTTGTLVFYRASQKTTAHAAVAASTALTIHTDASGYVGGAVISTSDYVLVCSSTGTVWTLSAVSAVAAVSSSTVALTLGTSITCAILDTIFIVRAADIVTVVTGDETTRVDFAFSSYMDMPVHVLMTATGNNKLGAQIDVED